MYAEIPDSASLRHLLHSGTPSRPRPTAEGIERVSKDKDIAPLSSHASPSTETPTSSQLSAALQAALEREKKATEREERLLQKLADMDLRI